MLMERFKSNTSGFIRVVLIRMAAIAGTVAITACVQFSDTAPREWSTQYGNAVIGEAFDTIEERYIEPVTLERLAENGLEGVKTIDSAIDFDLAEQTLKVSRDGAIAGTLQTPAYDNSEAWTGVTVSAINLARTVSPALREADAEAIFRAVLDGALSPLDPFSRYADAATANENRALRDGFGGIGVSIRMEDDHARILSVNDEGPARRAGLQPQDRVVAVNDTLVSGWSQRELVKALRGYVGTPVSLSIVRNGTSLPSPVTLVREHIVPQTVSLNRDGRLAIIRITSFNQDTAERVEALLAEAFTASGPAPDGFVLDMRTNPGGLLNRAVEVADVFVDRGQIVTTDGRHRLSVQKFPAAPGDATGGRPLVVLINGDSASAAEVVAAALQDLGRAVVVGTNSYGKGTVQSVIGLPNQGELTLTWSRLLAPSGYRLHELGVLPTLCTHGGGSETDAAHVLDTLQSSPTKAVDQFVEWRSGGVIDAPERAELRSICPADSEAPTTDIEVARALIADPALYHRALNVTETALAHR